MAKKFHRAARWELAMPPAIKRVGPKADMGTTKNMLSPGTEHTTRRFLNASYAQAQNDFAGAIGETIRALSVQSVPNR
jgi:hypothetical protein